jgi:hypothetical protein
MASVGCTGSGAILPRRYFVSTTHLYVFNRIRCRVIARNLGLHNILRSRLLHAVENSTRPKRNLCDSLA